MEQDKKRPGLKTVLSAVYLLVSLCLLLGICAKCYPQADEKLRQALIGAQSSPVREAFSVLTQGLTEDVPVKEVLSRSYEVLLDGVA